MVIATTVLSVFAKKDGTVYSAPNLSADQTVILLVDIVTGQENVVAVLAGLEKHARNAKFYPDANMEHVLSLWNVNVKKDGQEFFVSRLFVQKVATRTKDIVENQESAGVKLDGGVKTANNVIHIQVVFTETVQNHGSVTANQDGEACYVIKN